MDDVGERRPSVSFNLSTFGGQLLRIGMRIDIKRSDGRVHFAYVAGINYENKSATVEWFEDGETKGKEIDMATIQALNPDIVIKYTHYRNYNSDNKFQSNSTGTALSFSNSAVRTIEQKLEPRKSKDESVSPQETARPASADSTKYIENIHNRTCSTVKEVEKLKKNREERRQRYADERAERKALGASYTHPHRTLINMITEFRRGLIIKPLSDHDDIENHLISVCVRKRPLNKREIARNEVDVITIPTKNQLILHEPKNKVDLTKYMENQMFRFDYAFDENTTNEFVYKYTAQPLVKTIFQGGFATCFAYGQTGSGKTHTMGGIFIGKNQDCGKGVYALATADIFRLAHSDKYKHLNITISSSFFEIYSGKLFDLLANKAKLKVLEDAKQQVQVVGLTEKIVRSPEEVLKLIQQGSVARTSGQTAVNINSSRSHAVFQIILRKADSKSNVFGKLSLIDLAGNERGADTSSINRQTRMEGAEINKSLLALKECIRALGRKKAHLPFRVSKLTQVLRDSFVGTNSRTCMIAMISPGVSSFEQSLNTLRYADRVKELVAENPETNQTDFETEGENSQEEKLEDEVFPEENDLKQLHSLSNNEITPELLNFHKIISELQQAEDKMIENQKQTIEHLVSVTERAKKLLKMSEIVDFNPEEYCNAWDKLINTGVTILTKAKGVVFDFKGKMMNEEKYSRTKLN